MNQNKRSSNDVPQFKPGGLCNICMMGRYKTDGLGWLFCPVCRRYPIHGDTGFSLSSSPTREDSERDVTGEE